MKRLVMICLLLAVFQGLGPAVKAGTRPPDDLPLTIVPAAMKTGLPMFFMISGDGGWTSFDQALAEALAARGIPVVGLDAQKYFWKAKTPDKVTEELSQVILSYQVRFGKEKVVLTGFSFGASIVPFIANRMNPALKARLAGVLSVSPDILADFEIHLSDMLNIGGQRGNYNVVAEMKKMKFITPVSFFGKTEGGKIATRFMNEGLKVLILPGDHHFGDDFKGIAEAMIKNIV
jgi:type IV secretory pathway VirJ component